MINALSIDLEEWFHISGLEKLFSQGGLEFKSRIEDNTKEILDILQSKNIRATFFILGCIAEQFPRLIEEINNSGHEIATHSFNHQQIYKQTPQDFSLDLEKSIAILKMLTGREILGFRAPDFSITKMSLWALDILIKYGIKYDCSIFPILHPRYGIPDAPRFPYRIKSELIEFPPSTIKIACLNVPIAGGAYFRILPYAFIRWAINRLNSCGISANIYIHPWELDENQPRLNISYLRKFTHYVNLKKTKQKLILLLKDFRFAPVSEVLRNAGYL